MEGLNYVHNYNFQHPPNSMGRWPSGWKRVGGNSDTRWRRVKEYSSDGRYSMLVENPTCEGLSGIREAPPAPVQVMPGEKWQAGATMRSAVPGKARIAVIFLNAEGEQFSVLERFFPVNEQLAEYVLQYQVPLDAFQGLVEVGIVGCNSLWIDRVIKTKQDKPLPQSGSQEPSRISALDEAGILVTNRQDKVKNNQYFVAILEEDTAEPRIQFGRHLAPLKGKKQEHITFVAPDQTEIGFYELYFSSTGPVTLELALGPTVTYMKYELPATELYLYLARPLRISSAGPPLVVKVGNRTMEPLSYTVQATGLARTV